ncbi:MAG TPA: GNAT family N-acetyltransferase [Pseudidiomarina sp.]|nr:GNAT family N-acetyltransferase [Pseudidiomarina sp.]
MINRVLEMLTSLAEKRHRGVLLLDGDAAWLAENYQLLQQQSIDLWLSDSDPERTAIHRYRDNLGGSTNRVLLDMRVAIHADALAACLGTVQGGGILIALLPTSMSAFKRRLLRTAQNSSAVVVLNPTNDFDWSRLPGPVESAKATLTLTTEQQAASTTMADLIGTCHLFMADRGRGKSTTLGIACRRYFDHYKEQVLVTAAHPHAVQTLLDQAGDAAVFCAWDKLLQVDSAGRTKRLIIDEAAAIPMHILRQLVERYSVWAVATTIDGYEGCGRGFAIRFVDWLRQRRICKVHELTQPLRWQADDPAELWLRDTLILHSEPLTIPESKQNQIKIRDCHATQLTEQELRDIMALLLDAHYQSSPNDLRLLLDGSEQRLLVAYSGSAVIGVVWYVEEGPIEENLQQAVMQGERRLLGHLMPQAIGFYLQQREALTWRWWRVTRIAVATALQRQGLGYRMLQELKQRARDQDVDALGSSFGADPGVMKFWLAADFQILRMGRKMNMASGFPNALIACGLKATQRLLIDNWANYYAAEIGWLQHREVALSPSCHAIARQQLAGFAFGHLPFNDVQFAWRVCDYKKSLVAFEIKLPGGLLESRGTLGELAKRYGFPDQTSMQSQLRQLARLYLERTR